jgi:hypothetical protein
MPPPNSRWFLPAFVALWLVVCSGLSIMSGWHELAQRFKSDATVEGERFRFKSAAIGWRLFPVGYGGCLFATVGPRGIALSIMFPFRFLHPRLVIPWSVVERAESMRFWFRKHTAVYIAGFSRRLLFDGNLGQHVLEAWSAAHERA